MRGMRLNPKTMTKLVENISQSSSSKSSLTVNTENTQRKNSKCPFESKKEPKKCIEMTDTFDPNSSKSLPKQRVHSAQNSSTDLDVFKIEKDKVDRKKSNSKHLTLRQPLLCQPMENIENGEIIQILNFENENKYKVEKYDENCSFQSKIQYIECLTENNVKNYYYFILSIFTLGIYPILLEMFTLLKVKLCYNKSTIYEATNFLIKCNDNRYYIKKAYIIRLPKLTNCNIVNFTNIPLVAESTKLFEFKFYKYVYSPKRNNFISIKFDLNTNYDIISRKMKSGLSADETNYQKIFIFKEKSIQNIKSTTNIIMNELSNPFYIVQIFCIIIFICDGYSLYWKVLMFGTIIILLFTLIETQSFLYSINNVFSYSCKINVIRKNKTITISSDDLVPGDIMLLPENDFILPCDLLLISGSAIVNECFLSGESDPVFKSHIPKNGDKFNKNDKKFILFSGTKMIQAKNDTIGLVIGVGFDTQKGKLIRSILFKENNRELLQNYKENYKIILNLLGLFLIGLIFVISAIIKFKLGFSGIIYLSLELLVQILPSAITISITIGVYISFLRLKHKGISCLDRNKIDIAGKVDIMCFDKTGTLTEDHVDTFGFRPTLVSKKGHIFGKFVDDLEEIVQGSFEKFMNDNLKENNNIELNDIGNSKKNNKILGNLVNFGENLKERNDILKLFFTEAIISCNCFTKINGKIIGDPLDLEMFKCSGWRFEENPNKTPGNLGYFVPEDKIINQYLEKNKESLKNLSFDKEDKNSIYYAYRLDIIRRFEFIYNLQRMSVLIKNEKENYYKVFSKGSPEKIRELCRPETIPLNYSRILNHYSSQGLRVVALSVKLLTMNNLQTQKLARESVERDMIFLGFFIVKNKLRPKTKRTINILQEANINILISTGDSVFTACSVAKECHIVPDDNVIYSVDIIPTLNKDVYELKMKELIVESIEGNDDEEENQDELLLSEDSSDSVERNIQINRKFSKMLVESVSEDDLESESYSYEESDIHLIIKKQKEIKLNSLKIPNMKIKLNHCFAITGPAFKILYDLSQRYLKEENNLENREYHSMFQLILSKTLIFARMLPEHKTLLIECLKNLNHIVGMCGDGANDIGALHCADIGLSLGVDETSTSAPFISQQQDIKCLLALICEGKACISNYVSIYKFMLILCIIQSITSVFLYNVGSKFNNKQRILINIFIALPTSILMSISKPIKTLTDNKPINVSAYSLNKTIFFHGLIMVIFQIIVYELMLNQQWYSNNLKGVENGKVSVLEILTKPSYDNTILFIYYYLQSIMCVIVFSLNTPFKKGLIKNTMLLLFLIASVLFAIYLIFVENQYLFNLFNIVEIKNQNFKFSLIVIAVINFFVSFYVEKKLNQYEEGIIKKNDNDK